MGEDGMTMGYLMGQESNGGNGMFGGDGWLGLILFAMIFGNGGWGGGFGGGQALTRAELYDGFAIQNIRHKIFQSSAGTDHSFGRLDMAHLRNLQGVIVQAGHILRDQLTDLDAGTLA